MGYRGKLAEQMRARELRAQSWTLQAIADELGVSKSSVSLWVRDVEFVPKPRNRGHPKQTAHPMKLRKQAELDQCRIDADEWARDVTERERFVYGLALYAGEGFKTDGTLGMANTSPIVLRFFVDWLRRFFDVDETRLRVRVYLHDGLDLDAANRFWSDTLDIPQHQFTMPYRAVQRGTFRRAKHVMGCPSVRYADSHLHRRVMAMIEAISSVADLPG
jgi:hypothetical protein